jgi:Planctomycete cytochrome C/WD domain, G-beta repeat
VQRVLSTEYSVLSTRCTAEDKPAVTFQKDVQPVFKKHCVTCHNADRPRGELDLSSYSGLMTGGVSGKAAVAGKPDESPVYTLAAHLDDPKMPPNKPKIPQRELDTIKAWIAGGLVEKTAGSADTAASVTTTGGLGPATPLARATPITALAVHPTRPLVAVPGRKQVLVFDGGKLVGAIPFPEGEAHVLRFSRDGKTLIAGGGVGGQSGKVVGFDTTSWKRAFEIGDETDAVLAADLSPDGSKVVLGGPGRVVKVFTVADGKQLHAFRKPTDWVVSAAFSPEGLLVAAGDRFGGLFVWESKSGKEFYTLRGHTGAVNALTWRADSNVLASASADGTVRVWDMHTGSEVGKWDAHVGGVSDVTFHSTGVLATGGRDGRVKVWDATGKSLADLGPAADHVQRIALSPDAKAVVSGDWSGAIQVWPLAGGAGQVLELPVRVKPTELAAIPVPAPPLPVAAPVKMVTPSAAVGVASPDVARKRAALKAVEDAAEKLKEEAARNPKNAALAKAYLQLCEAALAMKAEVLEAEAANPEGKK